LSRVRTFSNLLRLRQFVFKKNTISPINFINLCTLDVGAFSSRDNHWSSDSQTIKTHVQKPSGIPIHSHMRGGRLDNAKARKLCTKPAGSILKYFGVSADRRTQAPKKYDQQTLSKESKDLAHACDSLATRNSKNSVRTLSQCVYSRWSVLYPLMSGSAYC